MIECQHNFDYIELYFIKFKDSGLLRLMIRLAKSS